MDLERHSLALAASEVAARERASSERVSDSMLKECDVVDDYRIVRCC